MATTKEYNVGYTRRRLARMLEKLFPDVMVDPSDLHSQIPIYASPQFDCCSWYGMGRKRDAPEQTVDFTSWDTMRECTRQGISWSWWIKDDTYEIHAGEATK